MAELHTLNNKQLREKCLEYGLPNVPVTDSSRKILIKRLQAVMSGRAPAKTTTKVASPTNRRKTVAATITTTISSGDEDEIEVNTKRNSVPKRRLTTQVAAPRTSINTTTKPTAASKSYNQHIIPIEIESRPSSTKINANEQRQRRSVSLSKTGVLTTSYSQETVPLQTLEQNKNNYEEQQEDEVDDVEMESVPDTQTSFTKNQNNYSQKIYNPPSYGASNFTTHTMPPPLEPNQPRLYPSLQGTGLQTDYYNSLDDILASHSSTARQTNLGFTYNPPTSYIPSPPQPSINNPRQTIGGSSFGSGFATSPTQNTTSNFLSSTTKRYTSSGATKRHTARTIDDEAGASSSDDQYESPYLNKYSRNLGNLQPEPVVKRTSTSYAATVSPTTSVASRYSSYSPMSPKRRRATYDNDNGISFSQFWATLEQKYHLKQALFFVMLFIVAVFIYVFFLQ